MIKHMLDARRARTFWEANAKAKSGGNPEGYIPGHLHPLDTYGGIQIVTAKRLSHCRACGAAIRKGEKCLEFGHDFNGGGSYTASVCRIHPEPCIP